MPEVSIRNSAEKCKIAWIFTATFTDGSFIFSASKEAFHLIDVYALKHLFALRRVCLQNAPGWIEVKMFARLLLLLLVLPSDARRGWAATSTSLTTY